MSVEQIVAEFRDTGAISPETASWVLNVYRYELAQHGDDDRARRTVVQLLSETAEQREKRLSDARRTLQVALSKHLASQAETNVSFALRFLQALLGVVAGAAVTTAATLLCSKALAVAFVSLPKDFYSSP
jgi:maltooligosyltrehalose synthase